MTREEYAPGCFRDPCPADPVAAAWEAYSAQGRRLADNPRLIADKAFMDRMETLHRQWEALFLGEGR